jgi:hypothetical protein
LRNRSCDEGDHHDRDRRRQHRVRGATDIDAPPERVWAVLADTARYPEWNPFVRSLDGPLIAGGRIAVGLQLPGRKLQAMRPTLVEVDAGRTFAWLGLIAVPMARWAASQLRGSWTRCTQPPRRQGVAPTDGGGRVLRATASRARSSGSP